MNRTIIIGNGFDLDLGLATSYKDFIDSHYFLSKMTMTVINNPHESNLYNYLKKEILRDSKWNDIECSLKQYAKRGKIIFPALRRTHEVDNVSSPECLQYFDNLKSSITNYLLSIDYNRINRESTAYQLAKFISIAPNVDVFSFNYTFPEKFLPELKLDGKIKHLHGDIDSDIVLGFDDSPDEDESYSYMRKSSQNNILRNNFINNLNHVDELIVFGHSFGVTDKDYFSPAVFSQPKRLIIITQNMSSKQSIINRLNELMLVSWVNKAEWILTDNTQKYIFV